MTDYTGNSKKVTGQVPGPAVDKNLQKVVTGEVVERKKSLGAKLKEAFIAADYKSTSQYVFWQVMLPAAKNMIWDMGTKAFSRTLYGQDTMGGIPGAPRPGLHGQQTHIQYNQPVQRLPWQTPQRPADPRFAQQGAFVVQQPVYDYVVSSQTEAQRILTMLQDTTETYTVATVADLHTLLGRPVDNFTDHNWGWESLAGARAYQTRQGWALEFPPPKPV
jgi:hypothetical protein